jgi:uncharacterized protein
VPAERKTEVNCPICKKTVAVGAEDFPFCSERCRLIDLGKWASGKYVVSSPVQDISDLLEQPGREDDRGEGSDE